MKLKCGETVKLKDVYKRQDAELAVMAVQAIRRMRGGAQSQLMLGADGHLWVVKFKKDVYKRQTMRCIPWPRC